MLRHDIFLFILSLASLGAADQETCPFCKWELLTNCGLESGDLCISNDMDQRWNFHRILDPDNVHAPVTFNLVAHYQNVRPQSGSNMLVGTCDGATHKNPFFDTSILNLKRNAPYRLRLSFWYMFNMESKDNITALEVLAIDRQSKSFGSLSNVFRVSEGTKMEWHRAMVEFEIPYSSIVLRFIYQRRGCEAPIYLDDITVEQSHTSIFTTTPPPNFLVTATVLSYSNPSNRKASGGVCDDGLTLPGYRACDPFFNVVYRWKNQQYGPLRYGTWNDVSEVYINQGHSFSVPVNNTVYVDIKAWDSDIQEHDEIGQYTFSYIVPSIPSAPIELSQRSNYATMTVRFQSKFS